jgi:hypothetical protein
LKEAFPMLFSIPCHTEGLVVDHVQFSNDLSQWNVSYIKLVHDWEVELVTLFFNLLLCLRLSQAGVDRMCWIPSKRQRFEISFFY